MAEYRRQFPMPKRKPSQDPHTAIVRAVDRATGSEPVKGEDLLPPELAKKFLDAKMNLAKAKKSNIAINRR